LVSKEASGRIEIFNPAAGYLIFDNEGYLTDPRYLPNAGGFLLWNQTVELISQIPNLDPGYISGAGWEEWQYSYFQDLSLLEIKLAGGQVRLLTQRKSLPIHLSPVAHLVTSERDSVFSEYPILMEPQFIKVTDNLTGNQWSLDGELGPIIESIGGAVDLTLSAGLGKSRTCKGLVIPGIQVIGLNAALKLEEKRQATIIFPEGWVVTFPLEFTGINRCSISLIGDTSGEIVIIRVRDPLGIEHILGVKVPILRWSVEYRDRENEMVATELKHKLEDRKQIQALILHEIDEYVPILKVGEVSKIGKRRGQDVRYDLRFLQDERRQEDTVISVTWNYETLNLISFRRVPTKQSLRIKDFKDLLNASIQADLFTLESWAEYQTSKMKESQTLKALTRNQRGR
jgi:hypothetical protein